MNAIDLLDLMQTHLGVPWQSQRAGGFSDGVLAGDPMTEVKGIATSFAATVSVLRRAMDSGANIVICREAPFWSRGEKEPVAYRSGPVPAREVLEADAVYKAKSELIKANNLVVMRFTDNWDARKTDGQLAGLAKALAWERYHLAVKGATIFYRPGNNYFKLPPTTLSVLAKQMMAKLHSKTTRVMGDAHVAVSKAALLPGMVLVSDLQGVLGQPGLDVIVAGEPVEWEGAEYLQDLITAKIIKGAILLGSEVSEEPGSGEVSDWLKTFVQVPVHWIPAGEPFTPVA